MVQTPVLSLAPGQTALVRGDLTVFPGETALGGEVNDIYTNSNYHPADPRAENNEARSRITVPEGC